MKKGLIILSTLTIMFLILFVFLTKEEEKNNKFKIVTSFYPTYVITNNLTKGIKDVEVKTIVANTTGCIHDYTLTPSDMIKIESADAFIINGAGMEGYISDVTSEYPNLKIIDSSKNIKLLKGNSEEEPYNAHIWLNPLNYIEQIQNISAELIKLDPDNKEKYEANEIEYIGKINDLINQMKSELTNLKEKNVIIFHDSFAYLASYLKLNVVHAFDTEESLSANEIEEVIKEIKEKNVKVLLVEKQFDNNIIDVIKNEVDVNFYTIDTAVTGESKLNAYLDAMSYNIDILKGALK